MNKRQEGDPVPLVELLEAAEVTTAGQLVDMAYERGWAVTVDALGRLAVHPAVAEQLRKEQEERERVEREAFERAEAERLAKLAEYVKQQEAEQLVQAREAAIRARQQRLEAASGIALWQLESEIRRSRTHAPGTGMDYDARAIEDDRPVTLAEAEEYIRQMYGDRILEGDDAR